MTAVGEGHPRWGAVHVNGKCFAQRTTGVQRYARCLLAALDARLAAKPPREPWNLWLPPGALAPPMRVIQARSLAWRGPGGLHGWEQVALPRAARDGLLLNLSGSAPAWAKHQACVMHDAAVFDHPEAYAPLFRHWYQWLFRRLGHRATPPMTVSAFSRERLSETLGIPAERLALVPGGADHLDDVTADHTVLSQHGLLDTPFLLAVGSANPTKNLAALVDAWEALARDDARLVIAGGVHPAVFADAGVRPAAGVIRLGPLGDGALKALYGHAAGLVFPSIYEGFGLPPLEAMACGCPVAAARAASLPEVCGDAALLFDPADPQALQAAMRQLLDDADLCRQLRARGRSRTKVFRWDRSAARLLLAIGLAGS